jgi:hypothetical protein
VKIYAREKGAGEGEDVCGCVGGGWVGVGAGGCMWGLVVHVRVPSTRISSHLH